MPTRGVIRADPTSLPCEGRDQLYDVQPLKGRNPMCDNVTLIGLQDICPRPIARDRVGFR